jgi:hypothetical protein
MRYAIYFFCQEDEVHTLFNDEIPPVGSELLIDNYVGKNEHRNGKYTVDKHTWVFDGSRGANVDIQSIHVDVTRFS